MVGCSLVRECCRDNLWTLVINIVDFAINCHSERSGTKKKKMNFQELSLGLITVLAEASVCALAITLRY